MSTELEQASSRIQTAATSLNGPKMSIFANKTGFVIPKNKLAGSLVPVYRGGKKGVSDSVNEESAKQVQRKTKWGPDLTQDTSVRKARALAYQSRLDQITQILSSRTLEGEGTKDSLSDRDVSVNSLELERREAIGEILKLNPSYKPPAGYKPILKEAKVPVPIKEHPGYNFIGLIFGPAHKQLEKETGAQVKVYGTKADTGEKVQVTSSGENDAAIYEEMYVQVAAETYEQVDTAVALIELLVTPVSATPVVTSTTTGDGEIISGEATPGPATPPVVSQPVAGTQSAQQGHFQPYHGQWFPGPGSVNSLVRNPHQVSPSPNNLSPFGRPLGLADGFGSGPHNLFVHSSPQAPRQPYMSSAQIGGPRQPIPPLSNMAPPQPSPTGFPQVVRPVMSSLPQPVPPTAYPDRPLTPTGWSGQVGSSNMMTMAPPPQGIPHLASRPIPGDVSREQSLGPQSSGSNPAHFLNHPVSSRQPVMSSFSHSPFPATSLNTNPMRPTSFGAPKPLQPSVDFTFQPHNPQNPATQFEFSSPPSQMMRPHLRPATDSTGAIQGFQRPQLTNQISHRGPPTPLDFAGGSTGPLPRFRHPTFSNPGVASPTGPQMQPMNFRPAPNPVGSFPPFQQNSPTALLRPQSFEGPNNVFFRHGRPASSPSVAHQIYDPFSPTSVARRPPGNPALAEKQENDPEYEDLMASVGVK